MSNYDYSAFTDKSESRLREEQHKCSHPSWKCSVCKLYKDNIINDYRANIEVLKAILSIYEDLLYTHNIEVFSYDDLLKKGIINMFREEKKRQFKHTDDL